MDELIRNDAIVKLRNLDQPLSTSYLNNPYIKAATSNNTRKAYQSDIRHFERWGGRLPATSEMIVHYLQTYAETLNPRTLARRITALKNWHTYQGFVDPTGNPVVTKTLTGITRIHGKAKQKARPLLLEELQKIVEHLSANDNLASLRDSALLQIGFFGAFRRSELVAIEYEDIVWHKEGIEILILQSKTDQLREGQSCVIPYGNDHICPVTALRLWLEVSNIKNGPIFKRLLANNKLGQTAITPLSVNHILKVRAEVAGIDNLQQLSSHSLRRGLATCAAKENVSLVAIMRQARWKQINTAMEYIEAVERFQDNAAKKLLMS